MFGDAVATEPEVDVVTLSCEGSRNPKAPTCETLTSVGSTMLPCERWGVSRDWSRDEWPLLVSCIMDAKFHSKLELLLRSAEKEC
jgi:hypothetical protein